MRGYDSKHGGNYNASHCVNESLSLKERRSPVRRIGPYSVAGMPPLELAIETSVARLRI